MLKKVLWTLIALLIAFAVFVGAIVVGISFIGWLGKGRVPSETILEIDFEQPLVEYVPDDPLAKLMFEQQPTVRDVVDALDRAAEDDRVLGLVARIGAAPMGMAQAEELRDAVERFRAAGKSAWAFSETFGEVGPGNVAYYLATAFDEIHLQPSGDVGLTGLRYESPFLRGLFDKLDVELQMDHRHEYKNAMNTFTETSFTASHREALDRVMTSQFEQMVAGIAEGRGLDEGEVRGLVDRGPFLGREAVEAGLVDALSYRDQLFGLARESTSADADFLYVSRYLERNGRPHARGERVALIYGVGAVVRGQSAFNPITGGWTMGSDSVAGAFREALRDDRVRAIVFRVDSPGGSYVASDAIWRETVRAKEKGIPVIVSMGNVAGSGGYFVAMDADKIVAQPCTITGSIGVLGGKLVTRDVYGKIGISFDAVETSRNASMWSSLEAYDKAEWGRFQGWLDRVYEDFTSKVAAGRGLEREEVLQIAKGRIWSGADALELGLVDAVGGLDTALALAREAAGLEADADIELRPYPRPRTALQALTDPGPDSSEPRAVLRAAVGLLEQLRPVARVAEELGLTGQRGVLTTADVPESR